MGANQMEQLDGLRERLMDVPDVETILDVGY